MGVHTYFFHLPSASLNLEGLVLLTFRVPMRNFRTDIQLTVLKLKTAAAFRTTKIFIDSSQKPT